MCSVVARRVHTLRSNTHRRTARAVQVRPRPLPCSLQAVGSGALVHVSCVLRALGAVHRVPDCPWGAHTSDVRRAHTSLSSHGHACTERAGQHRRITADFVHTLALALYTHTRTPTPAQASTHTRTHARGRLKEKQKAHIRCALYRGWRLPHPPTSSHILPHHHEHELIVPLEGRDPTQPVVPCQRRQVCKQIHHRLRAGRRRFASDRAR